MNILKFFDSNVREIGRFRTVAEQVTTFEPAIKQLTDAQLAEKTVAFRQRLEAGETLEELMPEAFTVVREASIRTIGLRHFDVQLIGAMVLHQGRIAEMKTGEGKTLVATLALYLNALSGHGAHLVTVNDYLSKRDARWMGPVFHILGLSVGSIHGQSAETGDTGRSFRYDPSYVPDDEDEWESLRPITRKEAYLCDITYGTNHEFGFDYLRDNMAFSLEELVQRELNYAIVDEVDSILVDEARTPLIISGHGYRSSEMYGKVDKLVRRLVIERDYTVDEKAKTAMLNEAGTHRIEEMTGCGNLTDPENLELNQYISAALKAHACFERDRDYVVKDGQVIIVDEFTGRLMFGRRWSDGLHQAVEAKENCKIEEESQTLATITYQNFFRLYKKLSGMTGTAKTEEEEFRKIYGLDVVEVPTNRPAIRRDLADVIYKSEEAKFRGLTIQVLKCYGTGQPVLVGTRSIAVSERVSDRLISERLQLLAAIELLRARLDASKDVKKEEAAEFHAIMNAKFDDLAINKLSRIAKRLDFDLDMLSDANIAELVKHFELPERAKSRLREALKEGIVHNVLNAKFHETEAEIVSEAGRLGAVTIATNMAGRGVDIILGGPAGDSESLDLEPMAEAEATWGYAEWQKNNADKIDALKPETIEVVKRAGLCIIGSERHESRRIDNQLRGRAGRQGDPGISRFYVSLEDELWRLFGDKSNSFLLGSWREDQSLDAGLLSKMIERAQKKVEDHHFDIRKHVLEYDDVMNIQRETIYGQRRKILEGVDLRPTIIGYLEETMQNAITMFLPEGVRPDEWDYEGLYKHVNEVLPLEMYFKPSDIDRKPREELSDMFLDLVEKSYERKEQEVGVENMRDVERHLTLDLINRKWIDHLDAMDYLREGIGLRGYAQKDPLIEYKKEAFDLFQEMLGGIQDDLVRIVYRVQLERQAPRPVRRPAFQNVVELSADGPQGMSDEAAAVARHIARSNAATQKVGRNDPCPCGSGKKYKKCCMDKEE